MRRFISWKRPLHGVGVDFGSTGVKAVALSSSRGELTVLGAGREPLPPGSIRDGAVQDADEVGAALRRLLTRLRIRSRMLGLAIGGSSVLIKRFPAPPDGGGPEGAAGLRDAVAREAARHVPFHLESLEFDYAGPLPVLTGNAEREPGSVVFGAAPREVVQAHCRAAAAAGRQVTRVELEPYALHTAVKLADHLKEGQEEFGGVAILEIGHSRSGVHVFKDAAAPSGGEHGSEEVIQAGIEATADLVSSVPAPGAGIPRTPGPERIVESGEGPAQHGNHPAPETLGGETRNAEVLRTRIVATVREAFREAGLGQEPRLFLSGGGATAPPVQFGLAALAAGDPVILDPLRGLDSPERGPVYSVAAGLAFQQILDQRPPGTGRQT